MRESAYRLLIVDDDKEVREGFVDIVDWQSCGFQVVAALKDGAEGISYLEQHHVDVVLSDIRMTFLSGLSLAKHIYEQNLPVRIVLISGYQEFELAKEALRYNVYDYLLKPTDLDELYRVFHSLKEQLDQEREERDRQLQQQEQLDRMFQHLIGMSIDPGTSPCARVLISWSSESPVDEVRKAMLHSLPEDSSDIVMLPHGQPGKPLHMLAVSVSGDPVGFDSRLNGLLERSAARVLSLSGLRLEWKVEAVYPALNQWLDEHRTKDNPTERKVITQAKQYIREKLKQDITLGEVAEQVYLNPVYLSRLFKLETGRSFSDYVTGVRMELAAELLRDTNLKIYEVCEQTGYKDVRHFYKLFKKHTGYLPSEYRERQM
ncbi:response regulator [Paenibacillus sp. J5C_2022]|uniref:helix-turn-helix domain-containing protein n=1 Tax=Paenibacillus sp. J5C2022 TaxID=2977129 RepID=UPI0021D14926|nr:helix-turn-helix domain-containing protein [Paenibacillus sp. J5C2022]MCU6710500.1 response regulator [Paenibacillus sp. J5C2022]